MSGHSKWSQIKRQKAVTDQRRSGLFTKLANAITIAAKQGGGDPDMNFRLRMTIDKAREANMPNDNIERAIKRVTGDGSGTTIEEVLYEAYAPDGIAVVIEAATDNKNRTASHVKGILSKHNASLGSPNSVLWMFDTRGVIRVDRTHVPDKEVFELAMIDAGANDIDQQEEGYTVVTEPENLGDIQQVLAQMNIPPVSADVERIAQNQITLTDKQQESLQKLLDALEEDEDITNCFTNAAG